MSLAARYKAVQVETATPPKLMMMLFDGALRNMEKGREALRSGKPAAAVEPLERAANIVIEFDTTLKREAAPELSEQLHEIYLFVIARLTSASTGADLRALEEAERVFRPIVEGFRQAVAKAAAQGAAHP